MGPGAVLARRTPGSLPHMRLIPAVLPLAGPGAGLAPARGQQGHAHLHHLHLAEGLPRGHPRPLGGQEAQQLARGRRHHPRQVLLLLHSAPGGTAQDRVYISDVAATTRDRSSSFCTRHRGAHGEGAQGGFRAEG